MAGYIIPDPGATGGDPEPVLYERYPPGFTDDGLTLGTTTLANYGAVANVSTNTVGDWVEIEASLSENAAGLTFLTENTMQASTTDNSIILDIGIGSSGNEVVWASFTIGYRESRSMWVVPGFIPTGSRVAIRIQAAVSLKAISANYFRFIKARSDEIDAPTSYGLNRSTSKGTLMAAPGATNTKGDWTEIVAATDAEHNVVGVYIQGGDAALALQRVLVDIGIGAEDEETVLVSNIYMFMDTNESLRAYHPQVFGVNIPVGSRLSARMQSSSSDVVDVSLVCA